MYSAVQINVVAVVGVSTIFGPTEVHQFVEFVETFPGNFQTI